MEMKQLDFTETFKDAITIGMKNAPSVIAAVALFLVTIWIPYINIGTFIAITLLPTQLAKGEVINPLGIFDSKYRRYMGEFLITMGLMVIPTYIAFLFMFVPGIVLSLAWSLARFERRHLRQQMDDVRRGTRIRHRRRYRPADIQRDLRHDQRRLHHVHRDVRPDRDHHVGRHGHQRFVLETAERQRGVTRPESLQRRHTVPSFFGPFNHFYRKTINIICFSKIYGIFAEVKTKRKRDAK